MSEGKKEIFLGDCLELYKNIKPKSIDLILTDLPYGTTACKWDTIIPFDKLWEMVNYLLKPNGAFITTASQPFSSALIMSNPKMFKYEWIWDKKIPSGMAYARFQPMRQHENILIFCKGKTVYNPQSIKRTKPIKGGGMSKGETTNNQNLIALKKTYEYKNPTTILVEDKIRKGSIHPTQKPVALFEYLIKTYTNETDLVLDNTAGSGTTAIACLNTNRQFIVMEKEQKYYDIILKRVGDFNKKFETQTLFGNEI